MFFQLTTPTTDCSENHILFGAYLKSIDGTGDYAMIESNGSLCSFNLIALHFYWALSRET